MIKLENIHTDAELLSVFKRLGQRFAKAFEEEQEALTYDQMVRIEEREIQAFVQGENVLELPLLYPIQEEVYPIDHETLSLIRELQRK